MKKKLWIAWGSLFLWAGCTEKLPAYRCTACLAEDPKQCFTYSDSDSGLSGHLEAACRKAQNEFCLKGKSVLEQTEEDDKEYSRCMDREFRFSGSTFYIKSSPNWFGIVPR